MVQYVRHRPESTLLYQVIERYYPEYLSALSCQGKSLPAFVEKEFEEYLKCGRLEHGFLRVRCSDCKHEKLVAFSCKRRGFCPSCGARRMVDGAALLLDEVLPRLPYRQWVLSVPFPLRWLFARGPAVMSKILGIVTRCISSYLIHKAGYTRKTACTGAVTLIQRFGSALNLNIHFHCLFLDGVYRVNADKTQYNFQPIKRPSQSELEKILYKISERTGRYLERAGLLSRDMDQSYLTLDGLELDELQTVQAHSIHYRIAAGTWRGKKVFTLQTLPPKLENQGTVNKKLLAKCSGFSLHAGVAAKAHERAKLERLCRYIARPAVSSKRLSLTQHGKIQYALKTPYRDGTTHVIFEPLDFIARLCALVPKPRANLTRFHGVFAPNSKLRPLITSKLKQSRQKGSCLALSDTGADGLDRSAMTWARRLKRVFAIDITTCSQCKGDLKIIACIEEQVVIDKILKHLNLPEAPVDLLKLPEARASPYSLF